ncbi:54S ribosomal protein L22, mitochondrial [Entophlyctis luteolus]|nr:54S ribosomal protein L22, mitochondrial [Entophlyctis luteolus]
MRTAISLSTASVTVPMPGAMAPVVRMGGVDGPRLWRSNSASASNSDSPVLASPSPPSSSQDLFAAALSEAAVARRGQQTFNPKELQVQYNQDQRNPEIVRFRSRVFRISPRKTNLVAKVVRGLELEAAIKQMQFTPKRAGTKVLALLKQAQREVAATRSPLHGYEHWIVDQCYVGKGMYLKRIMPHAKGRFGIMHHPSSRVFLVLRRSGAASTFPRKKGVEGLVAATATAEDGNGRGTEDERAWKKAVEREKLAHIFRRHRLYAPFVEAAPRFLNPVWSRKSWKYVTTPRWVNPTKKR